MKLSSCDLYIVIWTKKHQEKTCNKSNQTSNSFKLTTLIWLRRNGRNFFMCFSFSKWENRLWRKTNVPWHRLHMDGLIGCTKEHLWQLFSIFSKIILYFLKCVFLENNMKLLSYFFLYCQLKKRKTLRKNMKN